MGVAIFHPDLWFDRAELWRFVCMEDIVILGFGGHARSVADSIIRAGAYHIIGYTDKRNCNCGFQYLGTDDALKDIYESGVHKAVLGVGFMGNSYVRDALVGYAGEIGYGFPAIMDPSAIIAPDAAIGEGSFIGKNAVVNAGSKVGGYCIINTGVIIEHENTIGDYSHIAVGAVLCGNVSVGRHSLVGANSTIIQGKRIGDHCVVGANSTVLANVGDHMKIYGIITDMCGGGGRLTLIIWMPLRILNREAA